MQLRNVIIVGTIAAPLAFNCEAFVSPANNAANDVISGVARDASPNLNYGSDDGGIGTTGRERRRGRESYLPFSVDYGGERHPSSTSMSTSELSSASSSSKIDQPPWYVDDSVVTLVPKFKIRDGMMGMYAALMPKFVELVKANEEGTCVHYGFVSPLRITSLLPALLGCIHRCSSKTGLMWHFPYRRSVRPRMASSFAARDTSLPMQC